MCSESLIGNLSQARNGIDSTDTSRPDNHVLNETYENNENVLAQQYTITTIANHDINCSSNGLNVRILEYHHDHNYGNYC